MLFNLESEFGDLLDALPQEDLAELADDAQPDGREVLPGGRDGFAFRWYLRMVQRKRTRDDVTVRPMLLQALARKCGRPP